ncbi:Zn-dependent hydrolase [Lachnospiraceae bacterium KM106-2]|nr:Zn-dependent hydrolase [Lachnospiraceae bacterium KM106-2]
MDSGRGDKERKHLVKITARIYYFPGEEETDRPYLYYIKGDHYSAAVDAGNSKAHVQAYYEAITKAGLPLPEYTVITHWHWDHTFGIPYVHGKTIANQLTKNKLIEVSQWNWTKKAMEDREKSGEDIAFCNECICKEYPMLSDIKVQTVDQGIIEPMELDLGGVHLQLFPRDSTHSRDALFIYAPEEKALFVGDGDCGDHYENNGEFDPNRLDSLLKFVEKIDFKYYFLGHDVPDTKEGAIKYLGEIRTESRR